MRSFMRRVSVAWCAGIALALVPATAMHVAAQALGGTIIAHDPLRPRVVLTNHGSTACQIALTARGTIAVQDVQQDGSRIAPVVRTTHTGESIQEAIEGNIKVLQPRESATVALPVVPYKDGHAIEVYAPSSRGDISHAFYPVHENAPLGIHLTYTMPRTQSTNPRVCETIAAATVNKQMLSWQVVGAASIVVALAVLVVTVRVYQRKDPYA